jgi:hypothetical protein
MVMRLTTTVFRRVWLFLLLLLSIDPGPLDAADKTVATLLAKDALTVLGQPVSVEARLSADGLLGAVGLGGEPIELLVDGKSVAAGMTGGDGRAFLTYSPTSQGVFSIQVRVGPSSRVLPAEGHAGLAVWERRNPIVVVELASLMESSAPRSPPDIGVSLAPDRKPVPDAAEELARLTQFYYRVIYVVFLPSTGGDGFRTNTEARDWLVAHKFPPGYVLVLPAGVSALGARIDELHAAGWKTIKTGISRSTAFAEAFLQRRMDAIIVPEPAEGTAPRKAKVAKDWKDVRKKL